MEENSDNQMETDVSSTTQDLPSPQESASPTSSMEVTVEITETTMEVEEPIEEPQDQSIDSNTPEAEIPAVTINIVSPKKITNDCSVNSEVIEKTPERDLVFKSHQKTFSPEKSLIGLEQANSSPSVLPSSPTKSIEGSTAKVNSVEKSPVKVITVDKSPAKVITVDKSPAKVITVDKSPAKVIAVDKSPAKVITVDKSPAKVIAVDKSPAIVITVDKSPAKVITVEKSPVKVLSLDKSPKKSTTTEKSPAKPIETNFPIKDNTQKPQASLSDNIEESVNESEMQPKKSEVSMMTSVDILIEPSTDSQTGSETTSEFSEKEHNKSLSRELRSLINSAKESKIISECTQLTSKTRKSRTLLDTSLNDSKKFVTRRESDNSQESNSSEKSEKSGVKRSMRSQNPEFVTKQKQFLNQVTGKKDDEVGAEEAKSKEVEPTSSDGKATSEEKVEDSSTRLRPDSYCWRCHWPAESAATDKAPKPVGCTVCPRTYHFKCLTGPERSSVQLDKGWVCPECHGIMQAESSETRSPAMRKITLGLLCDLLKYALKRMMEVNGVEPFMNPVDRSVFPEYDKFVVHPMDLSLVQANIDGGYYGSTEAFAADVQWILHNSIIFNTLQSKLTAAARALLRSCRAEMGEIEACPECYAAAHARRRTWFTDVCSAPHILLWAKLKGFPYWPAKGMSVSGAGMVDVRFFGAHDRAWVPARDCYLYSEKDPNNFKQKRQDIVDSMQEAEDHIRNISRKFGKFVYPAYKIQFEPSKITEQLKIMIPGYVPETPSPQKLKAYTSPAHLKNKRKSMSKESTEESPRPASLKNKRKSTSKGDVSEESSSQAPAAVKNKRKSLSKEEVAQDSPRPKRRVTEKEPTEEAPAVTSEDKTKKADATAEPAATKEPETRKRRRSVLEEAVLTVMDSQEKRPRLETQSATTDATAKDASKEIKEAAPTDKEAQKTQPAETSTPKTRDRGSRDSTPKSKSRGSTPKIVLRQVPKNKTPKTSEKPEAKAREKSSSSEKDKSSDEKSKKSKKTDTEASKSNLKSKATDNASPAPKAQAELSASASSPKKKEDENTNLAAIAKKNKVGALNIPLLISNVRSLQKPATANSSPKNKPADATEPNSNVFTKTGTDNVNNMKDAMEKLQRLRNDGAEKSMVGKVGVRAFARMTSPPADNSDKVEVEVKAEPIDIEEADRQSEKIDLLNSFRLRPVNPSNLREVRINKAPIPVNVIRKPCPKSVEVRPRAKKTFPQPKKPEEGRSELNSKNSMVYIPIQPPTTSAPRPPPPRLNGPANPPPLRQTTTVINSSANSMVNTMSGPLMTVGGAPALGPPALGQVPSSVHTVPFITSVNGQWTFSLQPVMAVGGQDNSNLGPQLNGLDRPLQLPTSMSNPPPLVVTEPPPLAASSPAPSVAVPTVATSLIKPVQPPILLPTASNNAAEKTTPDELPRLQQKPGLVNPLDPAAPLGDVPPPSGVGPVTAKLNLNATKLTEFFRTLLLDSLELADNPRAQLAAARRQLEALSWKFQQQVKEITHNHELQIAEMRTSFEKERARATAEAARAAQAELDAAVKHAKSRQWCANCQQEAQFYCCWNTSYCDYPCQRAHWAQHYAACAQHRNKDGNDRTIPAEERLQPPDLPANPSASVKTVGGKVIPPRVLPAPPAKSSIIVSMVEDAGGNHTVKCLGTYKPPNSSPLLINKQIMNNEENAPRKVVTSGGYLIVGAGNPAAAPAPPAPAAAPSAPVVID